MLIDSPRLTAADRAHWASRAALDARLAADPWLDAAAGRARKVIEQFAAAGPCYVGVSWGRDSVLAAHLVATSGVADRVPVAWARARHWETPECELVRDAFLAAHPHVTYVEREFVFRVPMRGEPGHLGYTGPGQDALAETLDSLCGGRYISGVRAAECARRRTAMRVHGHATARTCRPIGWWTTPQVFAAAARWDLPVHPAYAMTMGGVLDRDVLRVHSLGGDLGVCYGLDRWEDVYYRDVLDAARAAREKEGMR